MRITLMLISTALLASGCSRYDDFADYEQILPRGRIAPIVDPQFVTAEQADIAADSYVLAVVVDGQARAYSLNLLNSHEVVNDRIGETSFAAVW